MLKCVFNNSWQPVGTEIYETYPLNDAHKLMSLSVEYIEKKHNAIPMNFIFVLGVGYFTTHRFLKI